MMAEQAEYAATEIEFRVVIRRRMSGAINFPASFIGSITLR